jgi:hypothetical protein
MDGFGGRSWVVVSSLWPVPIEPSAPGVHAIVLRQLEIDRSPACTGPEPPPGPDHIVPACGRGQPGGRERTYEPTVFFIRNQGFVKATAARRISFEDSLVFEQLHEQTYRDLGFKAVNVPAGPLSDRVALILQAIGHSRGQAD